MYLGFNSPVGSVGHEANTAESTDSQRTEIEESRELEGMKIVESMEQRMEEPSDTEKPKRTNCVESYGLERPDTVELMGVERAGSIGSNESSELESNFVDECRY